MCPRDAGYGGQAARRCDEAVRAQGEDDSEACKADEGRGWLHRGLMRQHTTVTWQLGKLCGRSGVAAQFQTMVRFVLHSKREVPGHCCTLPHWFCGLLSAAHRQEEVMGRKLWCYEPRCLLLLMTTSVLILPLRDSFQPGHVARRCRHQSQSLPTAAPRPWKPYCTLLPTRHPPRLLRPLKGSGREPDVAGSNAEDAGDDSDSTGVDGNTAGEEGGEQAAARAGVKGDDIGAINAEGKMRDWKQSSVQSPGTWPAVSRCLMTPNTTPSNF